MGCISLANFVVLINGSPSNFFKVPGAFGQGCPLSLFVFLLVVKGLSWLIHAAKEEDSIKGVSIAKHVKITHLQFVDDVLIFGERMKNIQFNFKDILLSYRYGNRHQ
jgi:hypothetical protein